MGTASPQIRNGDNMSPIEKGRKQKVAKQEKKVKGEKERKLESLGKKNKSVEDNKATK